MDGWGGENGQRKANLLYSSSNDKAKKGDGASSSSRQPTQHSCAPQIQQLIQPMQQPTQHSQQQEEETHVSHGEGNIDSTPSTAGIIICQLIALKM